MQNVASNSTPNGQVMALARLRSGNTRHRRTSTCVRSIMSRLGNRIKDKRLFTVQTNPGRRERYGIGATNEKSP